MCAAHRSRSLAISSMLSKMSLPPPGISTSARNPAIVAAASNSFGLGRCGMRGTYSRLGRSTSTCTHPMPLFAGCGDSTLRHTHIMPSLLTVHQSGLWQIGHGSRLLTLCHVPITSAPIACCAQGASASSVGVASWALWASAACPCSTPQMVSCSQCRRCSCNGLLPVR